MLLQAICARIGIATGRDLAQLCRERFPRWVSYPLWLLAEAAICATGLAEVIGTAIALQLLFGIPLLEGVVLTVLDTLLILWLQHKGVRWLEAFVMALIALIAGCFIGQVAMADPVWGEVLKGYLPSTSVVTDSTQLYLAMGILGATVMPHNLYLHTAIVQSRDNGQDEAGKREAIRFAGIDSTVALVIALLINSAILITAAAAFHVNGQTEVAEIGQAHALLAPLLGAAAPILFAVALLPAG
ncbi:MAG: Divalent metal cation transporter MntH [Roseomonas sp.]|nr:Divalent metal cation transporter MntH [Roseomonas sp.]